MRSTFALMLLAKGEFLPLAPSTTDKSLETGKLSSIIVSRLKARSSHDLFSA